LHRRLIQHRSLLTLAVTLLASLAVSVPAASAKTNGNFVGAWTVNTGVSFTITSEDSSTGACTGVSALAGDGYDLTDCQVDGWHYTFTITYGSDYTSVNNGWFLGPWLIGKFSDSNGTTERYYATRPFTF
jgi:hypothetical protein